MPVTPTKEEILARNPDISSQQAIVKLVTREKIRPVKFQIPGGSAITKTLDAKTMPAAIFTWLRRVPAWTQAVFSLASNPSTIKGASTTKVVHWELVSGQPYWLSEKNAREKLANDLAGIVLDTDGFIAAEIRPDGIYVTIDTTNKFGEKHPDFSPFISLTPIKPNIV